MNSIQLSKFSRLAEPALVTETSGAQRNITGMYRVLVMPAQSGYSDGQSPHSRCRGPGMSDPPADPIRTRSAPVPDLLPKSALSDSTCTHTGEGGADVEDAPPAFHPPTQPGDLGRLGRYRILKPLGKGGMGAVYLGFDDVLERKIAIKVLTPKFAANKVARDRFLREARTAASVSSPHVVSIIDVGEDLGIPYIAMEYLQGIPLDRYLATHSKLSLRQVLRIGQEVARGLAAAHAAGLVHRDIKPANLWLEAPHGRVKILDFGLAKETEPQADGGVTQAGQVVGTPAFMSPEQARGDTVDARTDLFCLGIVLYRLCTGHQPFVGPTAMSVLMSVGIDEPIPVRQRSPKVPEALATLIYRLLRKKPAERPQTATEVHATLVAIEDGKSEAVPEATAVPSGSEYIPITVPSQGDRVWEQFDGTLAGNETTTSEETQRKVADRAKFPWLIVGGVLGALLATLALVAFLAYTPKPPAEPYTEPEPTRPHITPPVVIAKADPDRRAAEWALGLPGNSTVELSNGTTFHQLGRLPGTPFKLRRIQISADYSVTDTDLSFLQELTGLEGINFGRTVLTDEGIKKLAGFPFAPKLVELSVGTEELSDEAMRSYVAFKALRIVSLTGPHLTHEGIRILLHHCPMLTHLFLDQVQIRSTDLAPFCLLRWFWKLEHLGISCPPITPLGLGYLATWPGLKSLHLSGPGVTDEEVDVLLRIPAMPSLVLRQTAITDIGLEKLAKLRGLKRLSISACPKVTPAGLAKFKAILPDCLLESHGNKVKDDPDRHAAEWALAKPGATVGVQGVLGQIATAEKLPRGPFKLTNIDLLNTTSVFHDADIDNFSHLTGLTGVRLGKSRLSDTGLKTWSETPSAANYQFLLLNTSLLTDAGLVHLKGFRSLVMLELGGRRITSAGMKSLAAMTTLTMLNLSNAAVTNEGLLALKELKNLKSLTLKGTQITADGVRKFRTFLPECRVICDFAVSATVPADPMWVAAVAKMPPAKQVEVVAEELVRRNPKFDGKVIPTITVAGVEDIQLRTDHVADIAPLAALTTLTRVQCNGDDRTLGILADISPLAALPLLREVSLDKNRGVIDLSPLKGKSLTAINLSFTSVLDISVLAGMPLKTVHLNPLSLKDLTPLLKCPDLADIFCDYGVGGAVPTPQIETLRLHAGLKRIEGIPITVFWPAWDRRKDVTKLPGPQKVIPTLTRDARWVAFDSEGKRLVSTGFDGKVQVWDSKTGERLHLFELKQFGQAAEFVAGTDLLAASYTDGIRFWNLKTNKMDGDRLPPHESFFGLAVSPDGKTILGHSGLGKGPISRHAIATRQPLPGLEGHTGPMNMSAFSRDSKHLITAAGWPDGSVRVWDLDTAKEVYRQDRPWIDMVVGLGFSPDNRFAFMVSGRSVIEVIDWKTKKTQKTLRWFPSSGAALAPGGREVILGGVNGVLTVLDQTTGDVVAEAFGGPRIGRVVVSPDGKTIATTHGDASIRLWDWATLRGKKP
ncbi:MAG: hypothetical protein C0467_14190 [Planctomycetaceae bacterium]|nr:hypothetical protein [Planctomycetaceae bacterium]